MGNNILVCLDNEGPLSKNDNAQESTVALAERCGVGKQVGINFYERLSNIDDIWGDFHRIAKDPTYSSGHTLKVILPFYKAMGADSQWLYDFAKESLLVVPGIDQVLKNLNRNYNVWMISTSYEFFIRAFCDSVGFDFSRVRCTSVEKFDEIRILELQKGLLLSFMEEVAEMPIIEYDRKTGQVTKEHQHYYKRFTDFIWEIVYDNMSVGEFLRTIHPVGQAQKKEAVQEICQQFNVSPTRVIYVGDSQTDVQVVEWLQGKGLTMMFNGKGRICSISDIMYIGEDARAIQEVVDIFAQIGRQDTITYYTPPLVDGRTGEVLAAVTSDNISKLEEMSIEKRQQFRGVHIGKLT